MNQNEWIFQKDGAHWLKENEVCYGTRKPNLEFDYQIKEVLFAEQSEFQHVMVLDSEAYGKMLTLDGTIQSTEKDGFIYNEMITHVPLSMHPSVKKVLIVGGGDCGAVREVAKYEAIEQIDMVEIDKLTVDVSRKYLPEIAGDTIDPRINFIFADGNDYIKQYKDYYDVIIVDGSYTVGPSEVLYQQSFYQSVYDALKADGIMTSLGYSVFFYADRMRETYKSIGKIFPITKMYTAAVPSYPGSFYNFNIGSKKYDKICVSQFDKETKYVNQAVLHSYFRLPAFMLEGENPF